MGSKSGVLVTCIYCKLKKPPTKEHILQKCLGGNLTLPRVCRECNNSFSTIDRHIADNTLVTMFRVANTPKTAFQVKHGGEQLMRLPDGQWQPVSIVNEYIPSIQPMMCITPAPEGMNVRINVPNIESRNHFKAFFIQLMSEKFDKTQIREVDWLKSGEAALLMHRLGGGYVAVGSNGMTSHALAFLRENSVALLETIEQATTPGQIPHPHVEIRTELRFNELFRGVAKIAFNLFASRTPEDVALEPRYDDFRDYILGKDVRGTGAEPDTRFVRMSEREPRHFSDYQHLVILMHCGDAVRVSVGLYRQLLFYICIPSPPTQLWLHSQVAAFKGDRTNSRWLSLEEIAVMLRSSLAKN